ncbi:hypothetical protein C1N74_07685 [Microbacterium sp. SGAir0570]|uniref:hypothetical protein n=1 Tax=Microbacterium sp. SGAir0570 TaxID=2070348 RepID=UPI0010CD699A|nr:hypothetical protein [Microbacterium sp. SGAir0570]QCR40314.1 hypothetical protein C1N74_07685 [Microbacterium sp. SGAir0570]
MTTKLSPTVVRAFARAKDRVLVTIDEEADSYGLADASHPLDGLVFGPATLAEVAVEVGM